VSIPDYDPLLDPPLTLDQLKALPPSLARARAIGRYIAAAHEKIAEATQLRYQDIAQIAAEKGVSETARIVNMAPSTVKTACISTGVKPRSAAQAGDQL